MRHEEARNDHAELTRTLEDEPTVVLRKRARSRPVPMVQGITAVLTVLEGRRHGEVVVLQSGENVVGRGREADVRIDDRGVSRRHVRLTVDVRGKVDLFDLGSTNGTFVNGERVTNESLRLGDRIRVGLEAMLELGQMKNDDEASTMTFPEVDVPTVQRTRIPAGPLGVASQGRRALSVPGSGDSEDAVDGYQRLLEIRIRRMGKHHVSVAELLEKMGTALQTNGQLERASDAFTRALEIHQRREPPAPRATARVLGRIANCDLALERPRAAVVRLERAERLLRTTLATPEEIGSVRLLLAQVMWRLGIDREHAMELARLARDVLASGGSRTHLLHHGAQAWIRSVSVDTIDE